MSYPGGKAGAGTYQRIINQIPPHAVTIEPFAGDAAILRKLRPAGCRIAVELDPVVAEALAAGFCGPDRDAESNGTSRAVEVYNCCGIEWLRHYFSLYLVEPPAASGSVAAESSGRAHRGRPPHHATTAGDAESNGQAGRAGRSGVGIQNPTTRLPLGRRRLMTRRKLQPGDPPAEFVYMDPPYLRSTRRTAKRLYRFELSEAQHVDLLSMANRLPCYVAISGYWSPLYAEALQQWRSIKFTAATRGRSAVEQLWLNYPEPTELHDYRYLGGEKRERERITRKARTWAAGLARLPQHEQNAILSAILQNGRTGLCTTRPNALR